VKYGRIKREITIDHHSANSTLGAFHDELMTLDKCLLSDLNKNRVSIRPLKNVTVPKTTAMPKIFKRRATALLLVGFHRHINNSPSTEKASPLYMYRSPQ